MSKKAVVKIGSDVEEAKKGIESISSQLTKLTNTTKKSNFYKLTQSVSSLGNALKFSIDAIKKVNATIKETINLANIQIKAEKQLEIAAKNNPYLNRDSVKQLENYASELQTISNIGDEQLIPMMAQLASAGRTQEEIQNIMAAALDLSASGMMSLDAAVSQLNKTFSGSAGDLGNQIKGIKNLSEAQLKSGEAVKIIAQQYKGMAEEVTKATGGAQRLKNAISDYKEEVGMTFTTPLNSISNFFAKIVEGWASAKKAKREYEADDKFNQEVLSKGADNVSNEDELKVWENQVIELEKQKQDILDKYEKDFQNGVFSKSEVDAEITNDPELKALEKQIKSYKNRLERAKAAYNTQVEENRKQEEEQKKAEEAALEKENADKLLKKREELRAEYELSIKNVEEQISLRRQLGEKITEEEEAQLLLNAATQAYIKMYSDPAFDRSQTKTGVWDGEEDHKKQISQWASKLDGSVLQENVNNLKNQIKEFLSEEENKTLLSETIGLEINALNEYISKLDETSEAYLIFTEKRNELSKLQTEVQKKELEEQNQITKDKVAEITDVIVNYTEKFAEISNGITDIIRKNNEDQTNAELTELSEQYTQGIISYEEYCEKKGELNKKAAQEEYKLKMWEWTSSLLQATANIAQGIAASLKVGMPAGAILAALTGAAGAVQIAAITANKPKAPSFATGGIVPGNSYSGDRVQANVNSGEMILNAQQQANLWKMANNNNSGSGAVVNMPVTIENNTNASVKTSLNHKGLKVIIDDIVNTSMNQGTYNDSMNQAKNVSQGVRYL